MAGLINTGTTPKASVSDADIKNWFAANQGATDQQIYGAMQQYGVAPKQLASAMGWNPTEVAQRYYTQAAQTAPQGSTVQSLMGGGMDAASALGVWKAQNANTAGGTAAKQQLSQAGVTPEQWAQATGWTVENARIFLGQGATTPAPAPVATSGSGRTSPADAPVAARPANSWDSLTGNSSQDRIIAAYQDFIGSRGGDTAANRAEAERFLQMRGVPQSAINSAYQTFLGGSQSPTMPAPLTPNAPLPGGVNGGVSGGSETGAAQVQMTPGQSVESRAAAIASTDSPLMQQARGRAMQQMNERGLINSSLAAQASQDAVLGRAIDIAKADATTDFQTSQGNANRAQAMQQAILQSQTALQQSQLSRQTQLDVADINRQYAQMTGLSSAALNLMTNFNSDVNQITLSDLPTAAKEAAIAQRATTLRASMNLMGSINGDVDLNNILNQILG